MWWPMICSEYVFQSDAVSSHIFARCPSKPQKNKQEQTQFFSGKSFHVHIICFMIQFRAWERHDRYVGLQDSMLER